MRKPGYENARDVVFHLRMAARAAKQLEVKRSSPKTRRFQYTLGSVTRFAKEIEQEVQPR